MRRTASARDDHPQASFLGSLGKVGKEIGGSMSGYDFTLRLDFELSQQFRGMAHRRPVGITAHHDCYSYDVRHTENKATWKLERKTYPAGNKCVAIFLTFFV